MERKDGAKNEETMRIRMSTDLFKRIQAAKVPCGWGEEADSSFARYLIIVGLNASEQIVNEKKNRLRVKKLKTSETEKSKADGKKALLFIDRMKKIMENNAWGDEILVKFGRKKGRLFIGDSTGLLKAISAKIIAEGYEPDTVLLGGMEKSEFGQETIVKNATM